MKRNTPYVLTNSNYQRGKTLLDATFEQQIAPLLRFRGTQFHIVPKDGNNYNDNIDNMLVAGYGSMNDVTVEEAMLGNVLNVRYDSNEDLFIYTITIHGKTTQLTHKNLQQLRTKIGKNPKLPKLINKQHTLTPNEYLQLYNDYNTQKIDINSPDFDIFSYKKW